MLVEVVLNVKCKNPQKLKDQLLQIIPPRNTSKSPPDLGGNFEKRVPNLVKAREETVTTPPPKESEHIVTTPPTHHREDSPVNYPPKDHPEASLGTGGGSVLTPAD